MNSSEKVRFSNGNHINTATQAKYLGVILEEKANQDTKIKERIKYANRTWNMMYKYWKLGKCSKKRKLQVWNAVIRSKLTYGLVTIQINKDKEAKIDALQLKGIRRILQCKTTYIDRRNTNRRLRKEANKIMNEGNQNTRQCTNSKNYRKDYRKK